MRVALVVPVALPCTPRGYGRGRWRRAAGRVGSPHGAAGQLHQPHRRHSPAGTPAAAFRWPVGRVSWTLSCQRVGVPRSCGSASSIWAVAAVPLVGQPVWTQRRSFPVEVFAEGDSTLHEHGFQTVRGRVVSRPRTLNNIRGHALGHCWSRFTSSPVALAITCVGCKPMIFWAFFA